MIEFAYTASLTESAPVQDYLLATRDDSEALSVTRHASFDDAEMTLFAIPTDFFPADFGIYRVYSPEEILGVFGDTDSVDNSLDDAVYEFLARESGAPVLDTHDVEGSPIQTYP